MTVSVNASGMMYIVSVTGSAVTVEVAVVVAVSRTVVVAGGNCREACCGLLSAGETPQPESTAHAARERTAIPERRMVVLGDMGPR